MKGGKCIHIFLLAFVLASCHVQKRKYLPGFYIHLKDNYSSSNATNTKEEYFVEPVHSEVSLAAVQSNSNQLDYFVQPDTAGCDTIRLVNGGVLSVRLQSYNSTNVMYTECKSVSRKRTVIYTKEVESIKLSDGRLIEMNSANYNHPKKFTTACYVAIAAAVLASLALILELWIVGFILLTLAGNFSWVGFVQMYNRDNVFGYVLMGVIWLACLTTVIVGIGNLISGL